MKKSILVFPSSTISAVEFTQKNRVQYRLVGASSDYMNSNIEFFDKWCYLPFVNDITFLEILKELLEKYSIKKIYISSAGVWHYFQKLIEDGLLDIVVINDIPYAPSFDYIDYFHLYSYKLYQSYLQGKRWQNSLLSYSEFTTILHYYHKITGESGDNKLIALMQIAKDTPKGDILEIGTQHGKSAFSLISISKKYNIGNILCIDPWLEFTQYDSPKIIQNMGKDIDTDKLFYSFVINLSVFKGSINYIKKKSDDAYMDYKQNETVSTEEFGDVSYMQRIALLHIDGNHDYLYVYNDLKNYSEFLVDFGWIVLDDYIWAYGDGPNRVGNRFLKDNALNINCCFCTDGVLFIQIKDAKKIVV